MFNPELYKDQERNKNLSEMCLSFLPLVCILLSPSQPSQPSYLPVKEKGQSLWDKVHKCLDVTGSRSVCFQNLESISGRAVSFKKKEKEIKKERKKTDLTVLSLRMMFIFMHRD